GRDDFFSLLDAVEHLNVAVAAAAELDRARLEAAFTLGDQHDLACTAIDDGAGGDGNRGVLVSSRLVHDVGVGVEFRPAVRGLDLDAVTGPSRVRSQIR